MSPFQILACFLNFIIGAGVLALPYTFYASGLVLSPVFLLCVSLAAFLMYSWMIETYSRATAKRVLKHLSHAAAQSTETLASVALPSGIARENLSTWFIIPTPVNPEHGLEVSDLCRLFLGRAGEIGWTVALLLFALSSLTAYLVIFAGAATAVIPVPGLTRSYHCNVYVASEFEPNCLYAYYIWAGLFGLMMVAIVLFGISRLAPLQSVLLVISLSVLLVASATVAEALFTHPYSAGPGTRSKPPYVEPSNRLAKPLGLSLLFSEAIFSQLGHQGVPKIARLARHKHLLRRILLLGLTITLIVYTLFSGLGAAYFGKATDPEATLNWLNYARASNGPETIVKQILRFAIAGYPMIAVSAAFPMLTVVVADTLSRLITKLLNPVEAVQVRIREGSETEEDDMLQSATFTASMLSQGDAPYLAVPESYQTKVYAAEAASARAPSERPAPAASRAETTPTPRWIMVLRICMRTACTVGPVLVGCVVRDLSSIISVTGLFGFFLMFLFPSLLQLFSLQWCRSHKERACKLAAPLHLIRIPPVQPFRSPWDTIFSSRLAAVCMTVMSCVLFSFAVTLKFKPDLFAFA